MKTTGYNSIKSWGIAVACGFVSCMIKIPLTASSMMFVAFVDRYATVRQNAAFFMTVCVVIRCFAGPVTGFLGEIIDLKHLTLVGCLIASFGTACCYFAEDIMAVTIFLGLIYGLGLSIAQPLLPQILKQHFNKNIANANGVFNSVSCILTFAIVPVISMLIKLYDVSGALLITAGIMLHGVPISMLLRNPKYKNLHSSLPVKLNSGEISHCSIEKHQSTITESKLTLKESIFDSISNKTHSFFHQDIAESTELKKDTLNKEPASVYQQNCNHVYDAAKETKKQWSKIQQKIENTSVKSSSSVEGGVISEENPSVLMQNSFYDCQTPSHKQNKYTEAFKTILVLRDPPFLVIALCQSLQAYVAVFLCLIIIDISRDKGFPQTQEYFFLMLYPVAEIIGHTCLGWVTDKGYLTVSSYISVCFLCKAIACGTFILSNNYFIIMTSFLGFGLCYAAICNVTPGLVYEFIEEKQQTMAIASRLLLYTPLILTMAPLIEYFRGTLGSYNGALYLLTGVCIGCSMLLLLLPSIAKCSIQKK